MTGLLNLTYRSKAPNLITMLFAKAIVPVLLTVALAAYGLDCSPTATAEQAMQCCKSMQCMRHHHRGQDCCKTMPSTRVDVGQPTGASISPAPVVFGMVQALAVSITVDSSVSVIAEHSHDPPLSRHPTVSPIRV